MVRVVAADAHDPAEPPHLRAQRGAGDRGGVLRRRAGSVRERTCASAHPGRASAVACPLPGIVHARRLGARPTILVQATFSDWSGGFGPPGRYALDFAPALAPAIAIVLREARGSVPGSRQRPTRRHLGALAVAFVWLHPQWGLTGYRSPFFAAVDHRVGPALDCAMPTFDFGGQLLRGDGSWPGGSPSRPARRLQRRSVARRDQRPPSNMTTMPPNAMNGP